MSLAGKRIVVTAGPTQEYFDPVRFITNRSTGTMGYELARRASYMEAYVHLISGPTHLDVPSMVDRITHIVSARDLLDATLEATEDADILIMAAAPCDERPDVFSTEKIKKTGAGSTINLVPNPDILATLAPLRPLLYKFGFAAETENHIANATAKAKRKGLDLIFVNDVKGTDSGFGCGANGGCLVDPSGNVLNSFSQRAKELLAKNILNDLADHYESSIR